MPRATHHSQEYFMLFQYVTNGRDIAGISTRILSRISAAVIFTIFVCTSIAIASEHPPVPTIKVSATGTAETAPDMAILNLSVMREARTAREALSANNQAMKEVIAALTETGIKAKDLQTANFNIQPRYRPRKSASNDSNVAMIVGYVVSNSLTVRLRDLKILGPVLDKVVTLGVNSGGNVQFTNQDPTVAKTRARAQAMIKAIAKAETLTQAAGAKLGDILSIREGAQYDRPVPVAMARANLRASAKSAVPLAAGENSYRVTVEVSWKIIQ
jgi:uncharacterized protein YggE